MEYLFYTMAFRFLVIVLLGGVAIGAFAFSADTVRNYYEWGEYQKLIDSLEPNLAQKINGIDSSQCAKYHSYLGVAYFAVGRIGEAQKQFSLALSLDSNASLDRRYISAEIALFFNSTRADYDERKNQARINDSLRIAQKKTIKENAKLLTDL